MTQRFLKTTLTAFSVLTVLAQPVLAGGMVEPAVEPVVTVEEAPSSSNRLLIPLLVLLLIGAAASSSNGGSPDPQ